MIQILRFVDDTDIVGISLKIGLLIKIPHDEKHVYRGFSFITGLKPSVVMTS